MAIKPTYKLISLFSAPKVHTDLLWDLTTVFVVLAAVFFISIFFFRSRITKRSRRTLEKKRELSPMISEFIFYSEDGTKEEKDTYINHKIHIRELLKDDFDRRVLASTLMELRKDVSGQAQEQLIDLYKNLGLHLDAYKHLKSWRWEVVAKGILELTQMQVTESYQVIVRFINDPRSTVRKQAEIATITLRNEGISYFLDTTRYKISEWQQLSLLEILRNNKDFAPPQFKAWLTSKNKHVVLFALRLIKHYNQNDASSALIELVKHRNDQIKLEAIACLKTFNVIAARDTLKLVFWRCSTEVKISIIGAISEFGDKDDIGFLKQIENKRLDFTVKSKALSAINAILPESILPTEGIEQVSNIKIPEDEIKDDMMEGFKDEEQIDLDREEAAEGSNVAPNSLSNRPETSPPIDPETETSEIGMLNADGEISGSSPMIPRDQESPHNDSAHNLHVVYDHLEADSTPNGQNEKADCPKFDLTDNDLGFLPIVIPSETPNEEDLAVNAYDIGENAVKTDMEKREIVDYPESGLIEEDLQFLPLVVSDDTDGILLKDDEIFKKSIEEFAKDYNEVIIGQETTVLEEILEQNFIEEQARLETINDMEVIFEALRPGEKIGDEDKDFIEWPMAMGNTTKTDDTTAEFTIESILSLIPKSYKFDDETASLIRLLSDIEELGDHREIPFLTELLVEESRPLIRERIQDVVYGIEKNIESENEITRHSVFEVLFKTCDTESKLILMDEMAAIGDEKEFVFLTKLLEDTNIEISTKAESILNQLENRLSDEALEKMDLESQDHIIPHEISLVDDDDLLIFTDEFALDDYDGSAMTNMTQPISKTRLNTGFLTQLKAIPNRLLEKLNG